MVLDKLNVDRVKADANLNIKKPRPLEVPSKEEIYNAGLKMYKIAQWNPNDLLALYFHLYLFGQRLTEALATKVRDFDIKKLKRKKKKNILLVVLTSINLKTKRIYLKKKSLPLVIDKNHQIEGRMFKFIYTYLLKPRLEEGKYDEFVFRRLIRYSPTIINYYFRRYIPPFRLDAVMPSGDYAYGYYFSVHPHFLRHCRLTHLVEDENLDGLELMKYAGWTTPSPAVIYDKSSYKRIVDKMIKS